MSTHSWSMRADLDSLLPSPCQGSSPAGGCLIALSCDYRIMAENPKYVIGLNEAQLGIVAPFWYASVFCV